MKKLFIGCRVKFINGLLFKEYNGREGRIVGRVDSVEVADRECDWLVVFDGETESPIKQVDGKRRVLWPSSRCLVPITPEGHQPVSWEECLWNPDMLEEKEAA